MTTPLVLSTAAYEPIPIATPDQYLGDALALADRVHRRKLELVAHARSAK